VSVVSRGPWLLARSTSGTGLEAFYLSVMWNKPVWMPVRRMWRVVRRLGERPATNGQRRFTPWRRPVDCVGAEAR